MKTLLTATAILLGTLNVLTQEREFKFQIRLPESLTEETISSAGVEREDRFQIPERENRNWGLEFGADRSTLLLSQNDLTIDIAKMPYADVEGVHSSGVKNSSAPKLSENVGGFDWKPALIQSGIFIAIQHGFRLTEGKTRDELDGPFFKDWKESVKNLRGWDDGGKLFTNYVGHPMQGAITGRIYVNNSPSAKRQVIGKSKDYWVSRLKAMAWSAFWSTQFEIGPISEASIGNVGQKLAGDGRSKMTYGDLVMTPVGGTAFLIAEDAIDKYILRDYVEKKVRNLLVIKILRSVLTPMTGFANLLRGHAPWWRDGRINSKHP